MGRNFLDHQIKEAITRQGRGEPLGDVNLFNNEFGI